MKKRKGQTEENTKMSIKQKNSKTEKDKGMKKKVNKPAENGELEARLAALRKKYPNETLDIRPVNKVPRIRQQKTSAKTKKKVWVNFKPPAEVAQEGEKDEKKNKKGKGKNEQKKDLNDKDDSSDDDDEYDSSDDDDDDSSDSGGKNGKVDRKSTVTKVEKSNTAKIDS